MKSSAPFLAAVLVATASAQVRLPFSRQHGDGAADGSARRRTPPAVELYGAEFTYVVDASVGTPPQNISLALTLSADESWVPDANDWFYQKYGAFWPGNSSTFVRPGRDSFTVQYTDGQSTYGDRIRETLWVGGAAVPNLTMGLAHQTSARLGMLALGFNRSSSGVPNFPDRMLAEGLVNSTAYSLWLDDSSAESGNVLFGAVDRAAFEPPLVRFPVGMATFPDGVYFSSQTFNVNLASVNFTLTAGGAMQPLVQNQTAVEEVIVGIDPNFSVTNLPHFLAQPIWDLAGVTYNREFRVATIPCNAASNSTARLALQLYGADGPVIDVPVSDLVLDGDGAVPSSWDWDTETETRWCTFGVQNTSSIRSSLFEERRAWSLGAPMLKRMYAVFDLANREMALARAKFGADRDDVVPFPSYGADIPESTKACNKKYDYCSDDSEGSGSTGRYRSGTLYDGGLSGGPLVGVVVGCIFGGSVVALGIILGILALARRRQQSADTSVDDGKSQAVTEAEQPPALPPRPPQASADPEKAAAAAQAVAETEQPPAIPPQPPTPADPEKAAAAQGSEKQVTPSS
ncbi:hypothetical protein DL766_003524 [Monosporascus sp. MC13-8B]|uniref:Peptidase A1 domain-containing protein n=1 Tax=Monosporascus cannonballus TaxID=155416 RepID=A0ABY0H747_9PEZI|nr:hypothetical protein DL762_004643 [Monosporascus cannonballus]RYO95871.1 hypothetical protein DL763_003505 [Monosporascus cannonballus]RYP33295.1 hypothetical protein DL766_003524 [Monosporascus sp. MC13-8B]